MFDVQAYFKHQRDTKVTKYRHLNQLARKGQILLAGSSLCEWFPIDELLQSRRLPYTVYNRGIGGDTIDTYAEVMEDCILELEPSKIFLNIGSNDMDAPDYTLETHREKLAAFIAKIRRRLPDAKLYLIAYYPVTGVPAFAMPGKRPRTNAQIDEANGMVAALAAEVGATYLDLNDTLRAEDGTLRRDYAADHMHMWPNAYNALLDRLLPYFDE